MTKKTIEEAAAQVQNTLDKSAYGDDIDSALLSIQTALHVTKDSYNQFGKYAYRTSSAILEAVKPLVAAVGCVLITDNAICYIGDRYYIQVTVTLKHLKTGDYIMSNGYAREDVVLAGMSAAQTTGACITYAKKYALCNLFAIDDSTDDPDAQQPVADEMSAALSALANAKTNEELDGLMENYKSLWQQPSFIQAGKSARERLKN